MATYPRGELSMKHNDLRSIAHNIADSFASGMGFLIGVYAIDVFGEAARSPERFIEVDFLTGKILGGKPSESLAGAVKLYCAALPRFCEKHRVSVSAFRELMARYFGTDPGTPVSAHSARSMVVITKGRS